MLDFYIVVTAEGKLKVTTCYKQYKRAENAADDDGDSVVKVEVPASAMPVFIRRKIV